MNNLLTYRGSEIHYENASKQGIKVNVTEFAKAFPNKNLSDIINSKEIKEYVATLSEIGNYSSADLLEVRKGGTPDKQGTWAHRMVALRIAQKLSPEFAIRVDTKIEELLYGNAILQGANISAHTDGGEQWYNYREVLTTLGLSQRSGSVSRRIRNNRTEFRRLDGVWFVSYAFAMLMGKDVELRKQHTALREKQQAAIEAWNRRKFELQYTF